MRPSTDTDPIGTPHPPTPRLLTPLIAASMLIAASTLGLAVPTAHAKPTPVQKCAAAKNKTAGKYAACLQTATANFVTSTDSAKFSAARAKCRATFLKGWATADAKAAKAGATCEDAPLTVDDFDESVDSQSFVIGNALAGDGLRRCGDGTRRGSEACDRDDFGGETCATRGFALGTLQCASGCTIDSSGCFATRYVDNGDGTVTDHQTGLKWEQKVSPGDGVTDPHDVDNTYTWSAGGGGNTFPDGTMFTDFLAKLNGASSDAVTLTGCFAGHCDWRLPTIVELQTILLEPVPCGPSPCIDPVFGPTAASKYWSATTNSSGTSFAWFVNFSNGSVNANFKLSTNSVRAVRTGS